MMRKYLGSEAREVLEFWGLKLKTVKTHGAAESAYVDVEATQSCLPTKQ